MSLAQGNEAKNKLICNLIGKSSTLPQGNPSVTEKRYQCKFCTFFWSIWFLTYLNKPNQIEGGGTGKTYGAIWNGHRLDLSCASADNVNGWLLLFLHFMLPCWSILFFYLNQPIINWKLIKLGHNLFQEYVSCIPGSVFRPRHNLTAQKRNIFSISQNKYNLENSRRGNDGLFIHFQYRTWNVIIDNKCMHRCLLCLSHSLRWMENIAVLELSISLL